MENLPLPVHSQWPAWIGAKKEGIFDQCDRPTGLYCRMISEQLMGINKADLHSTLLVGESAGTHTQGCGVATIHLTSLGTENLGAAIHHHFFPVSLLIIEAHH